MSEKEILDLEDKRFGAMIKGDFKALDAMVHEQLLYTHSSGNTDIKPSWLESIKSGRTKYKAVNCSDRKVRLFGDVALITGRAAIEAEIGGQRAASSCCSLTPGRGPPSAGNSSLGNRRRCRLERGRPARFRCGAEVRKRSGDTGHAPIGDILRGPEAILHVIAFSPPLALPASALPLQRRLADKYRNVQGRYLPTH